MWEHTTFNSRLQPAEIRLGTSAADANRLRLDFAYGPTAENNGNVRSQTITVPAASGQPSFAATQTYEYDALNRLGAAWEAEGVQERWKQVYSYDRYGNRRLDPSQTTSPKLTQPGQTALPEVANPSVQPSTNRMTEDQNGDGSKEYSYDAAGNLTCDAQHCTPAPSPTSYYEYDAENKLVRTGGGAQAGGAEYAYDGDGSRVKKTVGAITTVFVYDASGKLIAEYSNQAGGGGTNYLTTDNLGSTRVVTDKDGKAVSRHDYLPFGEEIDGLKAPNSGRGLIQSYNSGSVRQKFTGYERDNESGLDFAQARMYGSSQGRFTSPDDFQNATHTSSPQSWNLYTYAANNPLLFTDPTGEKPTDFINLEGRRTHIEDGKDQVLQAEYHDYLLDLFANDRAEYDKTVEHIAASDSNLHMTVAQFNHVAGTLYAESSYNRPESVAAEAARMYSVLRM